MAVVTLLTDFGHQDAYVGVMKGVILSVDPSAVIVDITHMIDPQNVAQAAAMVPSAHPFFPAGTIHVVVVDPGVGGRRDIVAVQAAGQIFLAPDNGVLTAVLEDTLPDAAVRVVRPEYRRLPVSHTFHGRDIFAPAAGHLSLGVGMERLGPSVDPAALVRIPIPEARLSPDGRLTGCVAAVDRFGNLITNIHALQLRRLRKRGAAPDLFIQVRGRVVQGLSTAYQSVAEGAALAVVGSHDRLEIAVNRGSAEDLFKAGVGDPVTVALLRPVNGAGD